MSTPSSKIQEKAAKHGVFLGLSFLMLFSLYSTPSLLFAAPE